MKYNMTKASKASMVGRSAWSLVDSVAEVRIRTYVDETRSKPVRVWILVGRRRVVQFVTKPENCLTEARSCVLTMLTATGRRRCPY